MIRRIIDIKKYWRVIVYYEVDYDLFSYIEMDLNAIGCHANKYKLMKSKAFTCSNIEKHISVVGINSTDDRKDFINSVVHESEHIKLAMLLAYNIKDKGEPPAYTIGYLVVELLKSY